MLGSGILLALVDQRGIVFPKIGKLSIFVIFSIERNHCWETKSEARGIFKINLSNKRFYSNVITFGTKTILSVGDFTHCFLVF